MTRIFLGAGGRLRSGWVLLIFLAVAALALGLAGVALRLVLPQGAGGTAGFLSNSLPMLAAGVVASLVGRFALQEPVGLAAPGAGRWLWVGAGLGAAALTVSVLGSMVGGVRLSATPLPWTEVLAAGALHLVAVGPQGIAEELLLRGVPLSALSRGLRPWAAVALTGLAFGVMHLGNPNASWVAAANVALVGCWFGALTVRTGSLWCAIGLHVSWNWFEGFFYGQPLSGLAPTASVFTSTWPQAPGFFAGGDFGPEASGLTAVLLAVGLAVTAWWPWRAPPAAAA